jgi:uncharacterized protein (DUF1330 family)
MKIGAILFFTTIVIFSSCTNSNPQQPQAQSREEVIKDSIVKVIESLEDLSSTGKVNTPELFRAYKTYATSFKDSLGVEFAIKALELSLSEGNLVNAQSYLEIAEKNYIGGDVGLLIEFYIAKLAYLDTKDEKTYRETLQALMQKVETGNYGRVKSLIMSDLFALKAIEE